MIINRDTTWRGGRVVEGAALEMLFRGNFNEGSNPSLSVPHGLTFLAVCLGYKCPSFRQALKGRL